MSACSWSVCRWTMLPQPPTRQGRHRSRPAPPPESLGACECAPAIACYCASARARTPPPSLRLLGLPVTVLVEVVERSELPQVRQMGTCMQHCQCCKRTNKTLETTSSSSDDGRTGDGTRNTCAPPAGGWAVAAGGCSIQVLHLGICFLFVVFNLREDSQPLLASSTPC
jgi:hypothetical protein